MPLDSLTGKVAVTLPLDILGLIVDNVFCFRDIPTLCALLTTSKAMFRLAAKRIYDNPWETAFRAGNARKTIPRLIAFVLSLAPPMDDESRYYLPALHLVNTDTARCSIGSLSSIDYLSLIRTDHLINSYHIFPLLQRNITDALGHAFSCVSYDGPPLLHHPTTRFMVPLLLRMESAVYWTTIHGNRSSGASIERGGDGRRRLGELRHLIIPVWELDRYMATITDLSQLESIEVFHPSERLLVGRSGGGDGDGGEDGSMEQAELDATREWLVLAAEVTVQAAITFVRQFNATHGFGRLRHVAVMVPGGWEYCDESRVRSTLQLYRELYSLLPAIDPPKALTYMSWIPYCLSPYRDRISLNQVAAIGYPPKMDILDVWSVPQDKLLQQCPALQELKISPLNGNIFKWAVDRRKHVAALGPPERGKNNIGGWPALLASTPRNSVPPPGLKTLSLICQRSTADQVANDAMYAFGATLEKFDLRINDSSQPAIFHLGEVTHDDGDTIDDGESRWSVGWNLPCLQELHIHCDGGNVRLAPEALTRCPMLKEVLCDEDVTVNVIGCQNLRLWQPWRSPMLKRISLLKSFSLCFHPESLSLMHELTSMTLHGPTGLGRRDFLIRRTIDSFYQARDTIEHAASSSCPLPLPDASLWTWTWDLWKLQELVLVGEPAFRFELKMLRRCPSLKRLQLRLGVHGRKLEFDDDEASFWEEGEEEKSISNVGSSLETLMLEGAWMLSSKTIRLLLTKVLLRSGLLHFHFGTHGTYTEACTIDEWIEYTKQHPHLQGMTINVDDIDPAYLSTERQLAMADRHGLARIEGPLRGTGISSIFLWKSHLRGRWVDPLNDQRIWIINGTPYTLKGSLKEAE
ncbi:hypothetical protein DFQ27_003479 [Actinomortierella ambigua]|uniref:Uncharacterized protein n=1 Tax=Actinomortierella ambigua TaxID=1343610 RepID=A0A9P6Q4L1_9FUNG|nr:hypothetical protein DFQ27_003479 [Actinomortierella ambigua]